MPKVVVRLISAVNLSFVSDLGYQEATVHIQIDKFRFIISSPTSNTLFKKNSSPIFEKKVEFDIDDPHTKKLDIRILDVDYEGTERCIGKTKISLLNLPCRKEVVDWYTLGGDNKARIQCGILAVDFDTTKISRQGVNQPAPVNDCKNSSYVPIQFNSDQIHRKFPYIAKGAFGVVFVGHVDNVSELIVIKDMEIQNQSNIENWKKEIVMMGRARCPYVVKILGYTSSPTMLTIVMEYMNKGSLYDVLHVRKEKISLLQRMRMARHCALGLAHLHNSGVIHRDVKSMNILVGEDYSCKLTDFGCAKLINNRTMYNTANSGTPLWMAPEVRAGKYDFSADIYSLGLVLFELFERQLPYFDQMSQTVMLPVKFQSSTIVLSCIAHNPNARPTAAKVVIVLDKMIRGLVNTLRKFLLPAEEASIISNLKTVENSSGKNEEDLDALLGALYQHFLKKDPQQVDAMINTIYSQASSNKQNPQVPVQMVQNPQQKYNFQYQQPRPPVVMHPYPAMVQPVQNMKPNIDYRNGAQLGYPSYSCPVVRDEKSF